MRVLWDALLGITAIDFWLYAQHRCGHNKRLRLLHSRHVGRHHHRYKSTLVSHSLSLLPGFSDLDASVFTPIVVVAIAAWLGIASGLSGAAASILAFVWHQGAHSPNDTFLWKLCPHGYRVWHLTHHTNHMPCNFGILTPMWDVICGTYV